VRSTHVPEQLVWPAGHWHAPPKHWVPPEHVVPQVPQLSGSEWVSVHPLPHAVKPLEQAAAHALDEHTWLPVHCVPQAPQLSGSFVVSTQEPAQATVGGAQAGLPPPVPLPVVVVVVPVVAAPPVPLVVVVVPVAAAPPVPLVVVLPVVEEPPPPLATVPVDVWPPEELPQPVVANPAEAASSIAPRTQEARDR
jgi:hypothetical protein